MAGLGEFFEAVSSMHHAPQGEVKLLRRCVGLAKLTHSALTVPPTHPSCLSMVVPCIGHSMCFFGEGLSHASWAFAQLELALMVEPAPVSICNSPGSLCLAHCLLGEVDSPVCRVASRRWLRVPAPVVDSVYPRSLTIGLWIAQQCASHADIVALRLSLQSTREVAGAMHATEAYWHG